MTTLRERVAYVDRALRSASSPARSHARLTAASSPLTPVTPQGVEFMTPEALRARTQAWQLRILELSEMVPEVAGAASLVHGSVRRVKFVVEGPEPARSELQRRLDLLDSARLAQLDFLSGEGWIAWPENGDPYVLSVAEIDTKSQPFRYKNATGGWEYIPDDTRVVRVWKPSASNRWHASSPNKSCMDLIDSMYLHQLADSAVATSRLAGAGVLVWPTAARRMGLDAEGNPSPGSQEEILGEFHKAAMQSIKNRDSKDATIPFVVFVDPDQEEWMPQLLRIDRDDLAEQYQQRFESYRLRYATAIDLPIEQTTGMGQTNHWSAWAIREDSWRAYLAPLVQRQLDAINLRIANPNGLTVSVDASDLIAKPDQTATILRLLQLENIDPEYAFTLLNLDPSFARSAPPRAYRTSQMDGIPSDFTLGGERGGGQSRD